MCEVPSWIIDSENRLLYVTDKDVEDYCQEHNVEIDWHDWTGHGGVRKLYPLAIEKERGEGFPCPDEILTALLNVKMRNICRHAENIRNWPVEMVPVLTELAKDKDGGVRRCVAYNHNTPVEVLTELAKDKDGGVRRYVANNHNTPAEALKY